MLYLALTIDLIVWSSCGLSSSSLISMPLVTFATKEITLINIVCMHAACQFVTERDGRGEGGKQKTLNITWPSVMINKVWNWPPLFSTILIAASTTGAKEVGSETQLYASTKPCLLR